MALDPSEHTVDDLREEVEGIDDPEELEAVLDAERGDMNRKTAKRALQRRIDEIEQHRSLRATAAEDASRASKRLDALLPGGR